MVCGFVAKSPLLIGIDRPDFGVIGQFDCEDWAVVMTLAVKSASDVRHRYAFIDGLDANGPATVCGAFWRICAGHGEGVVVVFDEEDAGFFRVSDFRD